jgi:antitoxin component YwqK of YwqJK toxin-antitoxin module
MLKYISVIILTLLFCQNVKAQKVDTLSYFMKNSGEIAGNKNEADYTLLIISADSNSTKVFRVQEYYNNNKPKLRGTSLSPEFFRLKFDGPVESFYPNGHPQNIINYNNGQILGNETGYFANGKLNYTVVHMPDNSMKYMECRDSTGKVLATNGNGKWVDVDDKNVITGQGNVVNNLQDGEWTGNFGDGARYVMTYEMGKPGKGIGYDATGTAHPFDNYNIQASFKGEGKETYSDFLMKNIVVPAADRQKGVGGRVVLVFVVELDGRADDIKVISAPDQSLADESIRVISLSTWNPGIQYGIPVRSYFKIPINYAVTNGK